MRNVKCQIRNSNVVHAAFEFRALNFGFRLSWVARLVNDNAVRLTQTIHQFQNASI